MSWIVKASFGGAYSGKHGTKKAAVAQAKEMTEAHEAIGAKERGEPVSFYAEKVEDPAPAEEPATEGD